MKFHFEGEVFAVRPRVLLTRSFDQRFDRYLGYAVELDGSVADEVRSFVIGIGKAAQAKHEVRVGDAIRGLCEPVENPDLDPVDFYKVSRLEVFDRGLASELRPPPWRGVPPTLEEYQRRGYRRMSATTYKGCAGCFYGCQMAVEMIIDQWNPARRKYRKETFCFGPKSCPIYRPGPQRVVPGRKGMTYVEEDWVDEETTADRGLNE